MNISDRWPAVRLHVFGSVTNRFLFWENGCLYVASHNNLQVEIVYTEDIDMYELMIYGGAVMMYATAVCMGSTTPGCVPKNPNCSVCNPKSLV